DAIEKAQLPDRRKDRPFTDELLDLVQNRFASFPVELGRLLLEQRVDIGIAAVDVSAAFGNKGLEAGRSIAKRTAPGLDDAREFLAGVSLEKGGPLERPKFGADADCAEIVDQRLGDIRISGVDIVFASVEAVGVTRLGQQLFGLGRIVDRF